VITIKTENESGIPSYWEIQDFQRTKGIDVNDVKRLYVRFKVGKNRKLKRLHIKVRVQPCDTCGYHVYRSGKIGGKEFEKDFG
jgi:hypothetical protein